MFPSRKQLRQLVGDDDGLTATEYAVMLALIIIVCISACNTLAIRCNYAFKNIVSMLSHTVH